MASLRTVVCDCGRSFETDALNRRKCYSCSPARAPKGLNPNADGTLPFPRVNTPVTPETLPEKGPRLPGHMETTIRELLTGLGYQDHWRGAIALRVARTLDDSDIAPAGVTSLTKQLEASIATIIAEAPKEPDEIDGLADELARRRQEAT